MSSFMIVFLLVILNTVFAVALLIWEILNKKGPMLYFHFTVILLCPVVGGLYLLGAYVLYSSSLKDKGLAYGDISFDATRHKRKQKGNFFEEVDFIPLEEAFIVSNKKDRRRVLLSALKKDYSGSISTILKGLNNDDGETRHFAATVALSTSTDYLNLMAALRQEYQEGENQVAAARNYLVGLKEYMQSDIMDAIDKVKYIHIHTEVLGWMYKHFRDEVTVDDFVYEIELLLESNNREEARLWADRAIHSFPDEDAPYLSTMKMYYQFGETDRFLEMLAEIMASTINVSNETLQTIRFFHAQPIKLT